MFQRILIANRGEIALRVIRACKELGIETVLVYSEEDADSVALDLADYGVCIGPAPPQKSYLDISRIISAAEVANIDAIHPGYGFLSENPHFAEICERCKITFIGPSPEAARLAGDKVLARQLAQKVKIPVVPGSDGPVETEKDALEVAHRLGYPVMIKAAGGGGGRGMRVAYNDPALVHNFMAAQAEAGAAFKNSTLYIERCVERARHVEIQILADKKGKTIHLGERDCTLQRRHQKLVEESPSPVVNASLRKELGAAAVSFAKAAGYSNAGTVEFLLDERGKFYFIEMNARIQVEHPVTEMVTGIDIVKEQILIAAGNKLSFSQRDVQMRGWTIEARINAEDPNDGFRPSPGVVTTFQIPGGPGVRVDSHVISGYRVSPHYDSLLAKIITHNRSRAECLAAMRRALSEMKVEGVKTTLRLQLEIFNNAQYIGGDVDTTFVDGMLGRRE